MRVSVSRLSGTLWLTFSVRTNVCSRALLYLKYELLTSSCEGSILKTLWHALVNVSRADEFCFSCVARPEVRTLIDMSIYGRCYT